MISQRQIVRLLQSGQFQQLVKRILLNGRCRNPLAVQVLSHPAVAEPVAVGLALQRLSELWYRSDESLDALAVRLTRSQLADGAVGTLRTSNRDSQIAATAVAVRAWLGWLDTAAANAGDHLRETIKTTVTRGIASLRHELESTHTVRDHPAGWAVTMLQLGDRVEFREAVCVPEVLAQLESCGAAAILDDLFSYARAMAA